MRYIITVNKPDYSPEPSTSSADTWEEALEALASELEGTADIIETVTDDDLSTALGKISLIRPNPPPCEGCGSYIELGGYVHQITALEGDSGLVWEGDTPIIHKRPSADPTASQEAALAALQERAEVEGWETGMING